MAESNGRTLVDVLISRATDKPDRIAYSFLNGGTNDGVLDLTYAKLLQKSLGIAATVESVTGPGDRILLLCPPGPDFVHAFLGCLLARRIAVPAYVPTSRRGIDGLIRMAADSGASVAVGPRRTATEVTRRLTESTMPANLSWVLVDEVPDAPDAYSVRPPMPDDIAFLQYTSGTTGDPKGVQIRHSNLSHNLRTIETSFGHTPDSRGVSWLPPYHDMGLIGGILQPLHAGFPVSVMSPMSFIRDPLAWLRTISRYGATTSGCPTFAYGLCVQRVSAEAAAELDLSTWDVAFVGAEPINPHVLDQFAEHFAPSGFHRDAFFPCYGLAESTLMVSGGPRGKGSRNLTVSASALEKGIVQPDPYGDRTVVSSGPVLGGHYAVVDPVTSHRCPPNTVGEIWLHGPSVSTGYWRRPTDNAVSFQATIADRPDTGRRFLRTGDLGFELDGELYITGREKDLIVIRGRNFFPQDIERTIEAAHPELRTGGTAALSTPADDEERLVIVQELDRRTTAGDRTALEASIREAVSREHALRVHQVVFVRTGQIPRTTSGKPQRARARDLVVAVGVDEEIPQ